MLPPQVQQRMQFDPGLGGAEAGPGEDGEAEIDGRGIQGIDGVVQVQTEVFVGIQRAGDADQNLSEVGVDPPVPDLVGVRERVPRAAAADAHVVQLGAVGAQAEFDIAQAPAGGELSERHTEELVEAGEGLDPAIATVAPDASVEPASWQEVHQLGEDESALMHDPLRETSRLPRAPGSARRALKSMQVGILCIT